MTEKTISPVTSVLAFAALVILTLTTVGLSFLRMGPAGHLAVGLGIGAAKAGLVAVVFMHLIRSPARTWLAAAIGLFWLGIFVDPHPDRLPDPRPARRTDRAVSRWMSPRRAPPTAPPPGGSGCWAASVLVGVGVAGGGGRVPGRVSKRWRAGRWRGRPGYAAADPGGRTGPHPVGSRPARCGRGSSSRSRPAGGCWSGGCCGGSPRKPAGRGRMPSSGRTTTRTGGSPAGSRPSRCWPRRSRSGRAGPAGGKGRWSRSGPGVGSWLADRLRFGAADRRVLLAAGMGAGVAAVFRDPAGRGVVRVRGAVPVGRVGGRGADRGRDGGGGGGRGGRGGGSGGGPLLPGPADRVRGPVRTSPRMRSSPC